MLYMQINISILREKNNPLSSAKGCGTIHINYAYFSHPITSVSICIFFIHLIRKQKRKRKGAKSMEHPSHDTITIIDLRIFTYISEKTIKTNICIYISVTELDERGTCPRLHSLSHTHTHHIFPFRVYIYLIFPSYIQGH